MPVSGPGALVYHLARTGRIDMRRTWIVATLAAASALLAFNLAAVADQKGVDAFACKDVMRSGDTDRDATIAFLHGYLLAKGGGSTIDVEAMAKQTDAFVERCLDNPAEKAVDAMAAVKK